MLREIIERETESNCVLSFSKAKIKESEFTAYGNCSECQGKVLVTSSNDRRTFCVDLKKGALPHTNTKLNRLTRVKSESIAQELHNKSVNDVYLSQAKQIPIDAENVPRNFVTKKSIENIKAKKNRLNDSAISVLRQMKYSPDFNSSIKELGTDPLCVIFWTKKQQFYFAEIKRQHGADISLDATGGLILNRSLIADVQQETQLKIDLPHVFLYLISIKVPGGKSIPIGQMLSAQQDSLKISYFLDRWMIDFGRPREVVMDDSAALLKSCAASFASCKSTHEYILKCFRVLNGDMVDSPKAFIRLDVAHFVHNLHRNKIMKNLKPEVKHLYLSVFGFLMQCENFETITTVVKHLIVLSNVRFCETLDEKKVSATESKVKLLKLVRSHEISSTLHDTSPDEEENEEDDQIDNSDQVTWFDDIFNDVMEKANKNEVKNGPETNIYYNPDLNGFFKKQMNRIPLWSAVMKSFFRSPNLLGTSNDTEARFGMIKNHMFKNEPLPTRPDIFVQRMVEQIDDMTTLNRLEIKLNGKFSKTTLNQSNNDLEDSLADLSLEV